MNVKEILKSVPVIRHTVRMLKSRKVFVNDSADFIKNYIEAEKERGNYAYYIMLLVHSLEKGMCMPQPRPYGLDKVHELIYYLQKMEENGQISFEYSLGLSVLNSWIDFYDAHQWTGEKGYAEVEQFVRKRQKPELSSGCKQYSPVPLGLSEEYFDLISSRHAVRDYKNAEIKTEDIDFAVNCFIETPTACNRQMCGLIYVNNSDKKAFLEKRIIGLSGFNKENTNYFIVTYDLAALAYLGERNQGLFNAGLCTTNFINGLHARGIGSCCLQWSNDIHEDKEVRKALGLSESERIAVIIGCGYYKETNIIPCSVRKTQKEIYRIV